MSDEEERIEQVLAEMAEMRDDMSRVAQTNGTLRNDVSYFSSLITRFEMTLTTAVNGERGLMSRVARVEQVQATRPCPEIKECVDKLEEIVNKNGRDIGALTANLSWQWRVIGAALLTLTGAALYTLVKGMLPALGG